MFYTKFHELCKERNVPPSKVASDIGLSKSAATYWKRGSEPKSEVLLKIADYFQVSPMYFLDDTSPANLQRVNSSLKSELNKPIDSSYVRQYAQETVDDLQKAINLRHTAEERLKVIKQISSELEEMSQIIEILETVADKVKDDTLSQKAREMANTKKETLTKLQAESNILINDWTDITQSFLELENELTADIKQFDDIGHIMHAFETVKQQNSFVGLSADQPESTSHPTDGQSK